MGTILFDQYSLLHFAVGIVAYFWGVSFSTIFMIHLLFELSENTNLGMKIINQHLPLWPGGKPYPDSILNMLGDTIANSTGWYCAYVLDNKCNYVI